ncbi:YheC/YheD family protein [Brevibacillus fulvus]|uniref:Glutathione synthase/RimK-type ligase-like ATP-grasp enzyme n=1 Tax=Brevibacillus fulvus TaxID=1125967 RepID=A0A938XYR8_9BACL|nr:YheC/YheD family protein [Brevibacillus fulvus]MBM7590291.1 glutathione synthase/RimK-type ligase-like ATP-grasp enzyme [Brevibacillus fulvus]
MYLKLLVNTERIRHVTLHPKQLEELGLRSGAHKEVRFGLRSALVQIEADKEVNERAIVLSEDIVNLLRIPLCCRYQLKMLNDVLAIGPFISFLTSPKNKTNQRYIHQLRDYLSHYDQIGGAVLAFALEGVNQRTMTIDGYLYNPQTQEWQHGTYPFPSVIFIRGYVSSQKWIDYFKRMLGKRAIFNDFYLDKWEMYNLLSHNEELRSYLPTTAIYKTPASIRRFLKKHTEAYLKPVDGTMGISVMKGALTKSGFTIRYRKDDQNKKHVFVRFPMATKFLQRSLQSQKYIIQQAIPLITYHKKLIDFRLIVVKNGSGKWEYMGMIARYGAQNSVVSNISAGGYAEKGEDALQKALFLTEEETKAQAEKMADLAIRIADYLDATGLHCGNMGIDLGVEPNGRIWIIEIQHYSPAHSIALDANQQEMYRRILLNNMLYMKRLSGFSEGGKPC